MSEHAWGHDQTATVCHARTCPVAGIIIVECNCGWFEALTKGQDPLPDHADDCPSRCNCDFGPRLRAALFAPSPWETPWWRRLYAWCRNALS